ncbi:LOW QUALITY PROTEIN: kazrin isoform X1 [Vespula squamosa]|uniref:Kazrin isoform X1 n=1 Tax=Vespula squamosa TaxID=30214 RepID=A0ABD2AJA5_VESSQ
MKALYGILEDKERELRDFIRNYEQRMRENEATLGRFQQQKGGMSSEERERERERGRWRLLRAVGNEADRSLSLAACLADKEVALSHARATIKELQRQLMEGGGGGGGGGGGARLSDQATPGAGSNSCGGVSGIIPHIDSQPPSGTTELGMTSNTSGGVTYAISSGGHAGDRGRCSADSSVRGSGDGESGGATSIGGNLSDSTTDPTLASIERILADAQTKLFVMTEKNAGTGARLDRELERGREESVILRGESCDVAALNDNGATSNSDLGSGGMINGNNNGSSPAFSGIGNTNLCQEENDSQTHAQEDGKRLRTVLIAAQLRREVRPATNEKNRPIGRKDRSSPIDRKSNPVETRNSSPCGSPGEKTRRSCALNRDKTRLGESRSRSVSPDRGSSNRTSFLHRDCSDLSGIERLRISTNPDSLRSRRFCRVVRRIRRPTFVRRSLIMTYDRRKKMNQDQETRLSGKFFRDLRRQRRSKVGARLSDLHGSGSSGVAEVARLRRLLLTGAARGEIGTEDAALEEEARFVALEMELQHAREALHALKADRKRFKVEKFDLIQGFIFTFFFMLRLIERSTLLEQSCN